MRSVTSGSFDVALAPEGSEFSTSWANEESIHWLAVENGRYTVDNKNFETGNRFDPVSTSFLI